MQSYSLQFFTHQFIMAPGLLSDPTPTSPQTPKTASTLTKLITGVSVRHACRDGTLKSTTAGLAPTYLQANLIILPSRYASDFRLLCARNPVPCPILAESRATGKWDVVKSWVAGLSGDQILSGVDLRQDAPKYMVYKDSQLVKFQCDDIMEEWTEDHVCFVIGCSFSFESELANAGLLPRHVFQDKIVPMYRTNIPLCKAGVFNSGTYVVSMRPYSEAQIEQVRNITRPFVATHGEPIAWGWEALDLLGIKNIDKPEWGDPPTTLDGHPFSEQFGRKDDMPVFWGCGVTPQEAVMKAGLEGTVMAHAPGHMLVLDSRDWDIKQED